jgi:hypothetical protein
LKQIPDNNSRALWKSCNKLFTISNGGENDIKKLAFGTQHQQLHKQVSQKQLSTFTTTNQDSNASKLMDGELTQIILLYSMSIPADSSTWNELNLMTVYIYIYI